MALIKIQSYSLLGAIQDNKTVLGGSAGSGGGTGDPPAGFVGQLTQSNVTFDTAGSSRACSAGSSGSSSLVDNLDAIRLGNEICDDAIRDRHIDWGHGAEQVDAEDVPFTSGSFTATNVHDALEEALGPKTIALADLDDYARGSIIRGGAADWEAYNAKTAGAVLIGDGTDIISDTSPTIPGLVTGQSGFLASGYTIAGAPAADSYMVFGFDNPDGRIFAYDPVGSAYLALLSDVDIYRLRYTSADTNVVHYMLRMEVFTTGEAAAGLGTGIEFQIEDDGGGSGVLGAIQAIETDATAGAEHGAIAILTADIGDDGLAERWRWDHNGAITVAGPSMTVPAAWEVRLVDNVGVAMRFFDLGDNDHDYLTFVTTDGSREVVVNEDGHANIDFRVESNVHAHAIFVEASSGRVGFSVATPLGLVHIDQFNATGNIPAVYIDQGDTGEANIVFSSDGADRDFDLFRLANTEVGTMMWDDSEDALSWDQGLWLSGYNGAQEIFFINSVSSDKYPVDLEPACTHGVTGMAGIFMRPNMQPSAAGLAVVIGATNLAALTTVANAVTSFVALRVAPQTWASYTGVLTNMKNLEITNPTILGSAPVNAYGIYMEAITVGTGTNYAIYSAGGRSYHVGTLAVGGTNSVAAQLYVDQSVDDAAIPVALFDQADLSEEFFELTTTVGAGNPIDTAGIGAYYGKARVMVTGVGYKVLALYEES